MITRKIEKIAHVSVTSDNIKKLATLLKQEYENDWNDLSEAERETVFLQIKFILETEEGIQIEDTSPALFEDDQALLKSQIIFIEMKFYNHKNSKDIQIMLTHSKTEYEINEFRVSGTNEAWIDEVIRKIKAEISSWQRPRVWKWKASILLTLSLSFGFALFAYKIFGWIYAAMAARGVINMSTSWLSMIPLWAELLGGFVLAVMFGSYIIDKVDDKMKSLYPFVELQMSSEYVPVENKKKRRTRRRLAISIGLAVIGIVWTLLI